MEIVNNEENQPTESNNKILFIWLIIFAILYIGLTIGVGLIGLKMPDKMHLIFGIRSALMPFLLFLFGYISSTKTKSYGEFIVFAVLMGMIIGSYYSILTKTLGINDLIILISNLLYMLAGFFIGNEGKKEEISRTRNIVFLVLLFLLILVGAIPKGLSPLLLIIGAPILITGFTGLLSFLFSPLVWFIYYALLLYFILFKRKWFYVVPAVALHIILSAILFFS